MSMTVNLTRRQFTGFSAAFLGAAVTRPLSATQSSAAWPDAIELARRQRSGELSPLALALSTARAMVDLDPRLGFLGADASEAALERIARVEPGGARIPTLIKDLHDQEGLPTRFGSRGFAAAGNSRANGRFVEGLTAVNLLSFGKSATSEAGLLPVIEPAEGVPCRNPWDLGLSAGGSSGGAAAAVAAGVVPLAHASDGGGSIRIPAALCGVFGFKPSRGRMAGQRANAGVTDLNCEHVITRSVRDSALVLAALQGSDNPALPPVPLISSYQGGPRLRIGMVTTSLTNTAPEAEVITVIEAAAALLDDAGHSVERATWPIDGARFAADFLALWSIGAASFVASVRSQFGSEAANLLEPTTLALAEQAEAADTEGLPQRLEGYARVYAAWFDGVDVLMSPVISRAQIPVGWLPTDPAEAIAALQGLVGYTPLQNVAGAPAMSVPLGQTTDGLPVGIHFAARPGADEMLIRLAFELEALSPWADRIPAMAAFS